MDSPEVAAAVDGRFRLIRPAIVADFVDVGALKNGIASCCVEHGIVSGVLDLDGATVTQRTVRT